MNLGGARIFRIIVKSVEPAAIDYEEPPMTGTPEQAIRQARKMARRTSYRVGQTNAVVYARVEAFDEKSHTWFRVWDKKGKVSETSEAPR